MRLLACLLLLVVPGITPEPRHFEYERTLFGIPSVASQACLPLDVDIFAHAARNLADVRLYHDGSEVPYVIRLVAPVAVTGAPLSLLNLGLQKKLTVFDAAMPDGNYSDVDLNVAAHDFIATVTVAGSNRQGAAGTSLGSSTIFDLTRQRLGRSTVLHLPESNFRYLHFEVAGPVTPPDITGLTVERQPDSAPSYKTVAQSLQPSQKDRSTIFETTVPAHVPVDRLVFVPGAEPVMFSRDVRITVQPDGTKPLRDDIEAPPTPSIFNGNLLRVHSTEEGHRLDEERLVIDASAIELDTPARWTISIANGDDRPIDNVSVNLEMVERDLCFEAAGSGRYTLFYGDAALATPLYDYSVLFKPTSDTSHPTAAAEQRNPIYESRPDQRPFTDRHPALLWSALIAVILVLGAVALRSTTRPAE
jgi:hypothetical protein